jgi:hypothetical protein
MTNIENLTVTFAFKDGNNHNRLDMDVTLLMDTEDDPIADVELGKVLMEELRAFARKYSQL